MSCVRAASLCRPPASSFDLLRRASTRPAIELLKLLDAAIFNVIIGNADAHGKNFSLLHEPEQTTLAPLYDLLCAVAYPDLSPQFAMKVARRGRLEEIVPATWTSFARENGLNATFVRRRVAELAEAVKASVPRVAEEIEATGLSRAALDSYTVLITARAERIARSA